MEKRNKTNSAKLALSYVPEIRGFGGKNSFAYALLTLGDEFLHENRERIKRLPEKHRAEFFALLSETLPSQKSGGKNFSSVFGVIESDAVENNVLLKKGAEWSSVERRCHLIEDFWVNGAKLEKIILTNPEKQNSVAVYDGEERFNEFNLSACFDLQKGDFFLYFNCANMLYRISTRGFWFSAREFDSEIYTNSQESRWFIQNGGETVPVSVEIVSPNKIALKAVGGSDFDEDDFMIGVEILSNEVLPCCNFTNPLFSFGMEEYLKPDLIIRGGEAREAPFYPFGYPLEEKSEFFAACGEAFSKRGAKVILWFSLHFEEFYQSYETLSGIDLKAFFEDDEKQIDTFKNIAPKEKICKAGKVSFQYFNGERFVLLPESKNHENLFNGREKCEFFFTVPDDIEICEVSGVKSYWIRVCLEEAENLYYRPVKMFCPQIKDIQITYGASFEPRQIKRVTSAGTQNIPNGGVIYENHYGEEPYFYTGFSSAHNGKLTLFINIEQPCGIPAVSGEWEVSCQNGFMAVNAIDDTECFSYSGKIIFDIPKEMEKHKFNFSQDNLYWLRTPLIKGLEQYPTIKAVYVNATEFYLNENCSKGEVFVLNDNNYQDLKAVTITEAYKSEIDENEEERLKHKILNTALMINEADISKTLLIKFSDLEEIKCEFDNSDNLLSVYLKFKGSWQEDCFSGRASLIKKFLTETCPYKVKLSRPVKALIKVRAIIDQKEREAVLLRKKLSAFLDYQSGGYNSRGWKIGELPDKNIIQGFFEENGVKTNSLVVSAGIYTGGSEDNYREYMIADLKGGFYASMPGEILLICGEEDGTDNS